MRYIPKQQEPVIMKEWKEEQVKHDLPLCYDIFPKKQALNEIFRSEQRNICCYCQRRIDHFQKPLEKGSHNEHLYPENRDGDPQSLALQMDYDNIFACCIDSRGQEPSKQYCGESKGNSIIPELIKDKHCSDYFRYNNIGEIVPNGEYLQWSEYVKYSCLLTGKKIADAYECIRILNLNATSLVLFRNEVRERFMTMIKHFDIVQLKEFIDTYLGAQTHQELLDMKLQLMRQRIAVLERRLTSDECGRKY